MESTHETGQSVSAYCSGSEEKAGGNECSGCGKKRPQRSGIGEKSEADVWNKVNEPGVAVFDRNPQAGWR